MSRNGLIAGVAVASAVYAIDKPYDYLVPAFMEDRIRAGQRVMVPFGAGNRKTEGFVLSVRPEEEVRALKAVAYLFDDEVALSEEDRSLALWMKRHYFCTFFEAANALIPPGMWNQNGEVFFPAPVDKEEALSMVGSSPVKREILQAIYDSPRPVTLGEIEKQTGQKRAAIHVRELLKRELIQVSQEYRRKQGDKNIVTASLAVSLEQAREQIGNGKLAARRMKAAECVAQAGVLPVQELCYLTGASPGMIKTLEKIGVLALQYVETYRRPRVRKGETPGQVTLSGAQQAVFDSLRDLLDGKPHAALLHGVTGSGKTQIYIELIRKVRACGKTAVMLVPEIALTPQIIRQFCLYFHDDVAVMHSSLTQAQRYDEYKRIKSGEAGVVIGTRTAVFAPLKDLGIVIIDEEQEHTYKSENTPRYHAREVAKFRCVHHGALLLMGSATPSVESFYQAQEGRYRLYSLTERFFGALPPQVMICDMRGKLRSGDENELGAELISLLEETLNRKEQSILLMNRRGSAKMAVCTSCGFIPQCGRCSVSLVYHSRNNRLMCHHCGFSEERLEECPRCGGKLRLVGAGTQKIEAELAARLPGVRVLRMDADTVNGRTTHEQLLDRFDRGEADILLGTQMVSKGLDFERVTLVGVVDADLSLMSGDFYATERTFSLLTQVVGRAGRRNDRGRAVIQTFCPDHPAVRAAASQDYGAFYSHEILAREALDAPPFCNLFLFTLSGPEEQQVLRAALGVAATLFKAFSGEFGAIRTPVLGPAPAAILKLNNRYRYTVSFRGKDQPLVRRLIHLVLGAFSQSGQNRKVSLSADMDPYIL